MPYILIYKSVYENPLFGDKVKKFGAKGWKSDADEEKLHFSDTESENFQY